MLGATGTTGRRVLGHLTGSGVATRAASRSGEVHFDWADPETWEPALSGARAVYLLIPEHSGGPDVIAKFARAAAVADVRSIVLLSTREAEFPGYDRYLETERAVQRSGTGWTILRASWFAQNFATVFGAEVQSGLLELPAGEGREPFIDAGDIAEAAARVLTEKGHDGEIYELSGPEPLSYREACERITARTGLAVRYHPITEEEYAARQRAVGTPEDLALLYASVHRPIATGYNDHVSDGVLRLLGRLPRDFDSVIADLVGEGVWPPV